MPGAAFGDAPPYVLAMSWQPGFCASDAGAVKAECAGGIKRELTLHGLWPNADRNGDGRMDEADDYCLGPDRARLMRLDKGDWRRLPPVDLDPDLERQLADIMPGTRSHLERHQWVKHGSCSGLSPQTYFATAIALGKGVKTGAFGGLFGAKAGQKISRNGILSVFSTTFGAGASRALQLVCRRADLVEIRLHLKGTGSLPDALDTGARARGNCPATIYIAP
ncbi:hypothetical protein [Dongia sp.]|uniref:ribonuclease T2 family protein n=1 Tax=Dongia sp. TaxID=1977262 RepID=UPI0035B1FB53